VGGVAVGNGLEDLRHAEEHLLDLLHKAVAILKVRSPTRCAERIVLSAQQNCTATIHLLRMCVSFDTCSAPPHPD
jgi:hypothetical protein